MILDWADVTIQALQNLWGSFLIFLPVLIGAAIIFIIGWFISVALGKLVTEILKRLKFNQIFEKGNWQAAFKKAEIKVDASGFVGAIIKWVFVILFLLVAVEILGLVQFADFLGSVLAYLPNVVVAVLIFVVTVVVVDIVEKLVRAGVESMGISYAQVIGTIARWSIWVFALLAIFYQLGIVRSFMETLFTGFVAMLVISFGLAFGLGGKDVAAEILHDVKKRLKE